MMGWRVVTTARRRQSLMTGDSSNTQGRERTKKAVIEMLAVVVFCFFVCWAPLHTQRLMYVAHFIHKFDFISEETYYVSNENLMYITGVFLYLNSTINPIIYNVISAKYRKAFKETLFNPSTCSRLFKETGVAAAAAAVGGRQSMKTEVTQFSLSKDNLRSLRHLQSHTTSMNDDV